MCQESRRTTTATSIATSASRIALVGLGTIACMCGALIIWGGCATGAQHMPVKLSGVSSVDADATWNCALTELGELGFTPEEGSKDAGFLRASKQITGGGTALWAGKRYEDVLTVALLRKGTRTRLSVTAATRAENVSGQSLMGGYQAQGARYASITSDTAQFDAATILNHCADGPLPRRNPTDVDTDEEDADEEDEDEPEDSPRVADDR
jgi:hypothetical protein